MGGGMGGVELTQCRTLHSPPSLDLVYDLKVTLRSLVLGLGSRNPSLLATLYLVQ